MGKLVQVSVWEESPTQLSPPLAEVTVMSLDGIRLNDAFETSAKVLYDEERTRIKAAEVMPFGTVQL